MAEDFGVIVTGDRKVELQFEHFPEALREQLIAPIKEMTGRLASRIRSRLPHGKTGELENSLVEQFFDDPDAVSGRVTFDADYAKAGALEWGAPGRQNRQGVKEHRAKLDHAWGRKLNSPLMVIIAAHNRHLHLTAHRFLRGPLSESGPEIIDALNAAVDRTIEKTGT